MAHETEIPNSDGLTSTAMQNWQAMSPKMERDISRMALTSADTILYQWDIKSGSITFSDNISDVLPQNFTLPRHIDDWQEMIDPRDYGNWCNARKLWETEIGTFEKRYRLKNSKDDLWLKHTLVHQKDNSALIGTISFNCRAPESESPPPATQHTLLEKYGNMGTMLNAGEFICCLQEFQEKEHSNSHNSIIIVAITSLSIIAQAFGQNAAEDVMKELEVKLRSILSSGNELYRIHRDQFGIIMEDCDRECATIHINKINDAVRNYSGKTKFGAVHTSSICGYSNFKTAEGEAATIIDRAFTDLNRHPGMLHAAQAQDPEDSMMARQQMGLANYLSKAISEDKLRLAYQPIIDSKTGEIAYYEALLRLVDKTGKVSSAGALIPIAERMGLINIVDRKVLEMVVQELETYPDVHLALNVSNLTTENPEWLQHIQSLLRDRPSTAERLTVEITETAAQLDLRRTAYFVAMIQELGCLVSLDDFGSGYTSFRQLKTLSVDSVKIDGGFIRDLTTNPDNRFFVKTLLEFTELFGLKSVAEYVENGETAKILMELGVDCMQGYYLGKPENQRSWLTDDEYGAS